MILLHWRRFKAFWAENRQEATSCSGRAGQERVAAVLRWWAQQSSICLSRKFLLQPEKQRKALELKGGRMVWEEETDSGLLCILLGFKAEKSVSGLMSADLPCPALSFNSPIRLVRR